MAAAVRQCEDEILDHARNPDNWGMEKSVFMDAADEAGIDIDDTDSIDEAEKLLREAGVKLIGPPDEVEPRMLSVESEQQFLDLFAHLLADVNRRFDVVSEYPMCLVRQPRFSKRGGSVESVLVSCRESLTVRPMPLDSEALNLLAAGVGPGIDTGAIFYK